MRQEQKVMGDKIKILVVDDESRMRKLVRDFLEREGYQVLEAGDGLEAMELFYEEKDIALLILDVMMPKMDGITVLQNIRAKGNDVPILILTAKSEVDDRVLGLDSGADDYLSKPFAAKELLARIRSVTRRRTEAVSSVLNVGNLSLDCTTFELKSSTDTIRLPNKEFQIMKLLAANPGQVISTERFMEKIWGYDSEADVGVVWVYISYLRKRLTVLGANVKIKAARGQGYYLEIQP